MADGIMLPDLSKPQPWWVSTSIAWSSQFIFLVALVAAYFLKNDTLIISLFTIAATNAKDVISYFFSSSASGRDKDASIAASTVALANSTPAAPSDTAAARSDEAKALEAKLSTP